MSDGDSTASEAGLIDSVLRMLMNRPWGPLPLSPESCQKAGGVGANYVRILNNTATPGKQVGNSRIYLTDVIERPGVHRPETRMTRDGLCVREPSPAKIASNP